MKIAFKDTIKDVLRKNSALFTLGAQIIADEIRKRPAVDHLTYYWHGIGIKKEIRSVSDITLGELDVLNSRGADEDYFFNLLGVMLGYVEFNHRLPDGSPDWFEGWEINKKAVNKLGFIRAFRYFIQCQEELERVAAKWSAFGKWKKEKVSKRPDRGLVSVCRQYCQLMNGTVPLKEVWNLPWSVVYEAFEDCDINNKAQYEAYEKAKASQNTRSSSNKRR